MVKPKFLKSAADMNMEASKYGQLLNRRKRGIADDFYMTTPQLQKFYNTLSKMQRDDSTLTKNFARYAAYNQFNLEALTGGSTKFQANLRAQSEVSKQLNISVNTVRRLVKSMKNF